jgi:hypothetical protein
VVASALEFANTLNAWRPFTRNAVPAALAFVCGWPTSELPLHALGLSALRLASTARRGDIQGSAAQHGFDFFESARARNSAQAVHDFLDAVYAVYAANRPPKRVEVNYAR